MNTEIEPLNGEQHKRQRDGREIKHDSGIEVMEARRFEAAGSGLGPEGYSDNGGGPACAGSRLIIAFNSLPGLK